MIRLRSLGIDFEIFLGIPFFRLGRLMERLPGIGNRLGCLSLGLLIMQDILYPWIKDPLPEHFYKTLSSSVLPISKRQLIDIDKS